MLLGSSYRLIKLQAKRTRWGGGFAAVDDEDYEWLARYPWFICGKLRGDAYGARGGAGGGLYAHCDNIGMHRLIMRTVNPRLHQAGNRLVVDHMNGNGLDNRRCNLRVVAELENRRNKWPYMLISYT